MKTGVIMVRTVKKAEVRRQEILEAVKHLFQTKGFDETSMQDVMDHLEIAKGTIYHYFKSKEELLEAVVEYIVDEDIQQKRALMEKTSGTALERFRVLVQMGSMAEQNDEVLGHLHKSGNMGMHIRLLAATLTKEAELYAELIRQGCEEGIFQTDAPLECAEFILSAVQFLTDVGVYPWTMEQLLRRAMAFPRLIEAQLKAPAGSFQFLFEMPS
jgi:AcrR family transcriptional regulator